MAGKGIFPLLLVGLGAYAIYTTRQKDKTKPSGPKIVQEYPDSEPPIRIIETEEGYIVQAFVKDEWTTGPNPPEQDLDNLKEMLEVSMSDGPPPGPVGQRRYEIIYGSKPITTFTFSEPGDFLQVKNTPDIKITDVQMSGGLKKYFTIALQSEGVPAKAVGVVINRNSRPGTGDGKLKIGELVVAKLRIK